MAIFKCGGKMNINVGGKMNINSKEVEKPKDINTEEDINTVVNGDFNIITFATTYTTTTNIIKKR